MELVSFGSRTERIGLGIRNALARCLGKVALGPRLVSPCSPVLSLGSFLPSAGAASYLDIFSAYGDNRVDHGKVL